MTQNSRFRNSKFKKNQKILTQNSKWICLNKLQILVYRDFATSILDFWQVSLIVIVWMLSKRFCGELPIKPHLYVLPILKKNWKMQIVYVSKYMFWLQWHGAFPFLNFWLGLQKRNLFSFLQSILYSISLSIIFKFHMK